MEHLGGGGHDLSLLGSMGVHEDPPMSLEVHEGLWVSLGVPGGSFRVYGGFPVSLEVRGGPPMSLEVHEGLWVSLGVTGGSFRFYGGPPISLKVFGGP